MNKNEMTVTLWLQRGATLQSTSPKPKPEAPGIRPTARPLNPKRVEASLEFANISSRELRVDIRLWFIRLTVLADGQPVKYIGPMVSLGPPSESDLIVLKPGSTFRTEPVALNNYYGLPDGFEGELEVSFQFSSEIPTAAATLAASSS